MDRRPPGEQLRRVGVSWLQRDVLTEGGPLPSGHVVLALGSGNPRPRWPWTLPLDVALTTARIVPSLAGREVTLISSIEVYGAAEGVLTEDAAPSLPWTPVELRRWGRRALSMAEGVCHPWRVAAACREFAEGDPSGRWVYAASKLIQEAIVRAAIPDHRLTVLRLVNTFGIGQERVVARLIRRALAGRELYVTPSVRSFLAVEDVARVVRAEIGPGDVQRRWRPRAADDLASAIRDVCRSDGAIGWSRQLRTIAAARSTRVVCGLPRGSPWRMSLLRCHAG